MNKNIFFLSVISLIFSFCFVSAQTETSKYANGNVEYTIQYDQNGDEHGEWKYYFENGQVSTIETYNHGWQSGLWASYYENGQLESQGHYNAEGIEIGVWEAYYENGNLYYKGEYANGIPVKEWKIMTEDGKLTASLSFTDKGKPTGEFIVNNKNGQPLVTGTYSPLGQKTGTWKTYYTNGLPKAEIVYVNDVITEIKSAFDETGLPVVFTKVEDGPLKGQWFDPEEDRIEEVNYYTVFFMVNF
jgi:antitoxin component YwqK of YwqJK toxin-antitoxin module